MSRFRSPRSSRSLRPGAPQSRRRSVDPTSRQRALLVLGALIGACLLSLWLGADATPARVVAEAAIPYSEPSEGDAPVAEAAQAAALDLDAVRPPVPFTIGRGQTASNLLADLGAMPDEIHPAVGALAEHVDLRKLRAGETGVAYYDGDGDLSALRLRLARKGWVDLERDPSDGWSASWRAFERSTRLRQAEGTLDSFLIADVEESGAPSQLAFAMSEVLQWDLDFNRDLRRGDTFRVLYEEEHLDGRFDRVSRVLAMVYVNRGVAHEAYRFGEPGAEGYYDGDGRPLQKMFLRSPLPFTRVTSNFSHSRLHPVLGVRRPHYGVDFGAPRGTPVRVTATGTVTLAGRNGGAGNMVRVRHANGYETSYLHLSGYGPGVRSGKKVRQGDIVGYVGSTGLSTAPHLDYRVKKDGRYMDPLKLRNRPAEPVPQHRLAEYQAHRDLLRSGLEGGDLGVLVRLATTDTASGDDARSDSQDPARDAVPESKIRVGR